MSAKPKEFKSNAIDSQSLIKSLDEKAKSLIGYVEGASTLGSIKEESMLKKRIDKLNAKFSQESEKFLSLKIELEKSNETLFTLLYKQIGLYIEEIEKLGMVPCKRTDSEKDKRENNANLKNSLAALERKLLEKNQNEEKMKTEINSLKRQVKFYKEKLQLELMTSIKKTDLGYKPPTKKQLKNNTVKLSMNNSTLEGKGKVEHYQEMCRSNDPSDEANKDKYNLSEEINSKPEEQANGNSIIDKIHSFHSNDKARSRENGSNVHSAVTDPKRLTKREKVKSYNFSPTFLKTTSKSPNKHATNKNPAIIAKNTSHNVNNLEKHKLNLNKYLNDAKGSNEKLFTQTHKQDFSHGISKQKVFQNIKPNEVNQKLKSSISSPRHSSCPREEDIFKEKEKEFLGFLSTLSGKFDDELDNLVEIENLLINAKLDLKLNENSETKRTIERNDKTPSPYRSSERNSVRSSFTGENSKFKPPVSSQK